MSDEMDEIWILFADDGAQSLDAMEAALENLQDGGSPEDMAGHISALFRAVHTFKGNSRVLGLSVVESRAHLSEDLIGLVRDEGVPLDQGILDVMFLASDTLRTMLDQVAATRADVDPGPSEDLMTQLKATIARCSGEAVPEITAEPAKAPEAAAPAPAAAGGLGGLGDGLGDIFASLGDGFSDGDLFDDDEDGSDDEAPADEEQPVEAAPAPAPTPAPAPAPAAKPAAAPEPPKSSVVIDETPLARLLDDPKYREIFENMVKETIEKLTGFKNDAEMPPMDMLKRATGKANSLSYASEQLELTHWCEQLDTFEQMAKEIDDISREDCVSAIDDLIKMIEALAEQDLSFGPKTDLDDTQIDNLLAYLQKCFTRVGELAEKYATAEHPTAEELSDLANDIRNAVEEYGYVRVMETADMIGTAHDAEDFRDAELRFYEELGALEEILTLPDDPQFVRPSQMFRDWCVKNITDTLEALAREVDNLRAGKSLDLSFRRFERMMRLTHHASIAYQLDSAGQLAMTLIDLFSRRKMAGGHPDAIMAHLAHGYIDTMELIFATLAKGNAPDTATLEELFEEAANISFMSGSKVTARQIERRLGLPEAFHRVLSPESVDSAHKAIEDGLLFYIIRADLNDDDVMAQAFLELIGSGNLKMITNVTVFQGEITLFDFLVGSVKDRSALVETLANIDPSAKKLFLERSLKVSEIDKEEKESRRAEHEVVEEPIHPAQIQSSLAMLETIGEISAGHAMVQHMLSSLAERDLMQEIDQALRGVGIEKLDQTLRATLRNTIDRFTGQIQEVSEAEAQLTAQLAELQEESVAMRSRPAEVLLNPLIAYVEAQSRTLKREAKMTTDGGEVALDQVIIEEMRGLLKSILTIRMQQDKAATKFHVGVRREEDHVSVIIDDNGGDIENKEAYGEVVTTIRKRNGQIRNVRLPNGGMRIHLSLALHMIVLDGMVVRVKDIHYVVPIDSILRIHQGEKGSLKKISASKGENMLRISAEEHVPIHPLRGSHEYVDLSNNHPDEEGVYVIVRNSARQLAIPVDELLGQQLVLLRPLRGVLSRMRDLTGIALLAGGEVGMVLAVSRLGGN